MAVRGQWVWENKFLTAYKIMATKYGLSSDPDDPEHFYDYRTLYKETGKIEPDTTGHFDSKYKLKGHPDMVVEGVDTKTGETIPTKVSQAKVGKVSEMKPVPKVGFAPKKVLPFENALDKIEYYTEKIVWLEGIAEERGGLTGAGYDAYRYSISQHNKFVEEYNASIPQEQDLPTLKKQEPKAMQRIGVPQRQRGVRKVPEYEIDTKDMPKAIRLIDDWMQGAMKGIPLGVAGFEKAFAGLMKEYGDVTELMADPSKFEPDPRWEGADEKFFRALYGGGRFKDPKAKVGAFISEQGQNIVEQADKWSKQFVPKENASEIEKWSADLHAGAVSLAGAVGFSYLTGSTAGVAAVFGLAARGGTYLEAREAGVPVLKAAALGGMHQVSETVLEFVGLELLFTRFAVPRIASMLIKGTTEYVQEYSQEVGGNLVAIYGWDKLRKWNENAARSGSIGFVLGIGAGGVIDYVSDQENAPKNVIKPMVEKAYQETLRATENIEHQDIIDSTQDYTMDVEPTATKKYDEFLEQSTEEILDQIDIEHEIEDIPEQYTSKSEEMAFKVKGRALTREEIGEYVYPVTRKDPHYSDSDKEAAIDKEIAKIEVDRARMYETFESFVDSHFENDIQYVKSGKDSIEVIKNPTSQEFESMKKEVRKQNAEDARLRGIGKEIEHPYGTEPLRQMTDGDGNIYIWDAYGMVHEDIAELIDEAFGLEKGYEGEVTIFPMSMKGREFKMKKLKIAWDKAQSEKKVTFAEGEERALTPTDVGIPVLAEYGMQVGEVPPIPPKRERKEWEPVQLPALKGDVSEALKFKEPILSKWWTPKLELMRQMGVIDILGNLPEARALEHIKRTDLTHEVNELIKKLNKGRGVKERFGTWIKNKPSKQVARLRDLLNAYEDAPDFLNFEEKTLFNEVRDLTRNLLKITNEFRKAAGLTEIHDLEAYIPHFLDEIARAAANGMYPYVADVYRWTKKKVPKRSTNPTARQRTVSKLTDMLNEVFSKDLGMLLKAMIKYDLRDIYLAIPYAQVRANIKQLEGKIPVKVLEELEQYMEYDIFDHQTDLDKIINLTTDTIGITTMVNFMLKPFGRIMTNPIQLLSSIYRQGLMGGAIAGKPRIVLRNIFQRLLTLDFVAPIDFAKAQFYAPTWQMEQIRDTTFYKISVQTFEDLPPLLKPVQWGMYPFQKSHAGLTYLSNIDVAMRAGWWGGQRKIDWTQTDKGQEYIKDYIAKRPHLTQDQKDALPWREGDQIQEAIEIGSYTQWTYFSTEMPRVFRGQGARAFWSLQSWWMNYFGKHLPEMSRRTFKGVTGRGRIVPKAERWRAAKGLAVLFAMLGALKKVTGIDMLRFAFFPFPSLVLPHAGQIVYNTYQYVMALFRPEEREGAWAKLKKSLQLLLPFSGALKRYMQMLRGDLTVKEWLFYMEQQDYWKQIWMKDKPKKEIESGVRPTGKIGEQQPAKIGRQSGKIGIQTGVEKIGKRSQ